MKISNQTIQQAYNYDSYKEHVDTLMKQGKSTGPIQNEELLHFTQLNSHRMKRVEHTTVLSDELKNMLSQIRDPQTWLVITEGWCGDGAQQVPVFDLIAKECSKITFKLILRDENLEVMDCFLTNGSRSIPKLLILNAQNNEVLETWGPRPYEAIKLINEMKEAHLEKTVWKEKLHLWYAKNKGMALQAELAEIIKRIIS
jgi:hypothetical protein